MSSLRKLQQEIDKTLKKVQEGLEVFDDHQEQYDTTDPGNTNAREKLESQVGAPLGRRARVAWFACAVALCRVVQGLAAWLAACSRQRGLVWVGAGRGAARRQGSPAARLLPPHPPPQLKDQIKKLQRLRDSIKSWCALLAALPAVARRRQAADAVFTRRCLPHMGA